MKVAILFAAIASVLVGVVSAAAPDTHTTVGASAACRTKANRQTALTFLDVMTRDGFHAAHGYVTDDYIWWNPRLGQVDMEKLYPVFQSQLAGPPSLEIKGVTAECNRVAVEAESHADLKNGKVYHNHYHFLFLFRGRKIAEIHEHNDSAHAAEVFGNSTK